MKTENKRNMQRQRVPIKDVNGNIIGAKEIHHQKMNPVGGYKDFWNSMNKSAKPNSKRQQKLKQQL